MEIETKIVEFRFPDGDFEVDSTEQQPQAGAVVTKKGRVWKVDHVEAGTPTKVTLLPAPSGEEGAVGWFVVGTFAGAALVIFLLVQIIQAII